MARTKAAPVEVGVTAAKRGGPMSVGRVVAVLEYLAHQSEARSLSELSRQLAAPPASLLAILGELSGTGFIRRNDDGRYQLGARSYRLASLISACSSLNQIVRAALAEISRELAASVSLGYLDVRTRELVYAERYGESSAVRYVVKFGPATHLHARATGKLLVALQPEESWPAWFGPEPYAKVAAQTHMRFKTLKRDLKLARAERVAYTQSEHYDGISGCAVPVTGCDGGVAAGIGIAMIGASLDRSRDLALNVLHRAARVISNEFEQRRIDASNIALHL